MQVKRNYREARLDPKDVAMLDYATKLTRTPAQADASDVTALRAAGWTDREILDICLVTAYRNYISRVADGLGVQLDDSYDLLDEKYRQALKGVKET